MWENEIMRRKNLLGFLIYYMKPVSFKILQAVTAGVKVMTTSFHFILAQKFCKSMTKETRLTISSLNAHSFLFWMHTNHDLQHWKNIWYGNWVANLVFTPEKLCLILQWLHQTNGIFGRHWHFLQAVCWSLVKCW